MFTGPGQKGAITPNEEGKSGEQKAAEAEVDFRKDLGPFVVAAEMTRMAMVFTDAKEPDNPIIFANDSFLSITGHDREEVLGQSFNFLMGRGHLACWLNIESTMWMNAS
jgi:PAS domain-containing protein